MHKTMRGKNQAWTPAYLKHSVYKNDSLRIENNSESFTSKRVHCKIKSKYKRKKDKKKDKEKKKERKKKERQIKARNKQTEEEANKSWLSSKKKSCKNSNTPQ